MLGLLLKALPLGFICSRLSAAVADALVLQVLSLTIT